MVARAARDDRRARRRPARATRSSPSAAPAPLHAAAIAEELGIERDPLPARVRRAGRARPGRRRAPPRRPAQRPARAATSCTDGRPRETWRSSPRGARALGAPDAALRVVARAALPRPGVRAGGRARRRADPDELREALRTPRTRSATATATPTARSSWSRCASPPPMPGPERRRRGGRRPASARDRSTRTRVVRRRASTRPRCSRGEPAPGHRDRGPGDLRAARGDARRAAGLGRRASTPPARSGWSARERRPDHAAGARRRAARGLRGDGRRARSAPRTRPTSRSAATRSTRAVRRRAARWSCRPSTSPSTSARCRPRSPRCVDEDHAAGRAWVLNDPYRGGTHLPDITVITPVFAGDELLGFAASRAHHADVGGPTPGSMPADSTTLEEEGVVIAPRRARRRPRSRSSPRRCASPPSAAPTCAPSWPPTAPAPSALRELAERHGRDALRDAMAEVARLRRAAHARLPGRALPDGDARGARRARGAPTATSSCA